MLKSILGTRNTPLSERHGGTTGEKDVTHSWEELLKENQGEQQDVVFNPVKSTLHAPLVQSTPRLAAVHTSPSCQKNPPRGSIISI